jgi:ribonuclease HII
LGHSVLKRLRAFDRQFSDRWVAGIDEAGRGPLAGPVVAAAVVFLREPRLPGLNDSKQLTPLRRRALYREICRVAHVGLGVCSHEEIDALNIYQATRRAMREAVLALSRSPELLLLDGPMQIELPIAQYGIVDGDAKSASIAAASVVAKVHRDGLMERLHETYPDYDFADHKGYATPRHLKRLAEKGPSPVHRRSFFPVQLLETAGDA